MKEFEKNNTSGEEMDPFLEAEMYAEMKLRERAGGQSSTQPSGQSGEPGGETSPTVASPEQTASAESPDSPEQTETGASQATELTKPVKPRRPHFAWRAMLAFLVMGAILVGIYLWAYNAYATVATWEAPGHHESLVYEGKTYDRVGKITEKGDLTLEKYPLDKMLGQVEDDGLPAVTEAQTLPPDAPEGETVAPIRPNGDPTVSRDHAYVLYGVKKETDHLILVETDGEHYLYQLRTETETES